MSNIRNEIKLLLIRQGISLTELVDKLNDKFNRNDTVQNLNNKLARGTIKYSEIKEIAQTIDYDLVWVPKEFDFPIGKNGIYYSAPLDEIKHKQKNKSFIPQPITSLKRLERSKNAINNDNKSASVAEGSGSYNIDKKESSEN